MLDSAFLLLLVLLAKGNTDAAFIQRTLPAFVSRTKTPKIHFNAPFTKVFVIQLAQNAETAQFRVQGQGWAADKKESTRISTKCA